MNSISMSNSRTANANDRLKNSFDPWLFGSIGAAVVLHFLAIVLFPQMSVADMSFRTDPIRQMEIPPEVRVPPPPEQIQRPQVPVMSANLLLDEDLTIAPVTFGENPVTALAPPVGRGVDVSDGPKFTPYEVKPELRDRAGFQRLLERRYPPMQREAGIGGTVVLWVYIDEQGRVQDTRVTQGSGDAQLDDAARAVMAEARFTPALNRDHHVPVWIQLPVTFQVR
ncbi:MAG: energy transducer TonB [Gemmatimonadetes bacterium]|nr:energy transducer TonB [Gemmatimonadota bacterium]